MTCGDLSVDIDIMMIVRDAQFLHIAGILHPGPESFDAFDAEYSTNTVGLRSLLASIPTTHSRKLSTLSTYM